jgi:hypothetical protein
MEISRNIMKEQAKKVPDHRQEGAWRGQDLPG